MAKKNSKNQDGRGRSAGSRRTQFSKTNQPDQSRRKTKRKPRKTYNAVDPMREAIFGDASVKKNGKSVKMPFIVAFVESLKKDLATAGPDQKIKLLREIRLAGLYDIEEFKQRISSYYRAKFERFKKVIANTDDLLKELTPRYTRDAFLHIYYFNAYIESASECTCGACERGFERTDAFMKLLIKALQFDEDSFSEPEDEDGEEAEIEEAGAIACEDEEDGVDDEDIGDAPPPDETETPEDHSKPKPGSNDDGPDDEFYSGMIGPDG